MRDPNRLTATYKTLESLHRNNIPDWRVLQFMFNLLNWITMAKKIDPFFIEDDELPALISEFFGDQPHRRRAPTPARAPKKK